MRFRSLIGASEFSSERYSVKGVHIGRVTDLLIDRTDVDRFIDEINHGRAGLSPLQIMEMRLGDPTKYDGLGPYDGFHRHLKRFINFEPSLSYAGYLIPGDESLKARLRVGRTKTPGFIHPPSHIEVTLTPGVAGALRLVNSALLLPPTGLNPEPGILDELEKKLAGGALRPGDQEYLLTIVRQWKGGVDPENVVIPKWTYVSHMAETSLAHADFRLCNIDSEGQVDLRDLESVIDRNTRAVLFATVGNPLTVAMKPQVFDDIVRVVHRKMSEFRHSIVVLADIIYEQFRRDRSCRIDPIQQVLKSGLKVPVVEMSSFSKMLAIPGERVGFIRVLWDQDLFQDERRDFFKALKNVYGPMLDPVACSVQRALGSMYTSIKAKLPVEENLAPIAAVMMAMDELGQTNEVPITFGDTQILFRDKESREKDLVPRRLIPELKKMGIEKGFYSCRKIANRTRKIANMVLGRYGIDLDSDKVRGICATLEGAGLAESKEKDEVVFYRLTEAVPKLDKDDDGQLKLYKISELSEWSDIAKRCGIGTEDVLYQNHKKHMRDTVFERVMYFANGLDKMRRDGMGVYLHPAYYDEQGNLDPSRFNAFYVLWGFERLRRKSAGPSQARLLAEKCVELGRPIIACVPGEAFIPLEIREEETSFIRSVALLPRHKLDAVLQTIGLVAREIDSEH